MEFALVTAAGVLVILGLIGTVVPALPGLPLIWLGFLMRGIETDFAEPSILTVVIIGVLVGFFYLGQLLATPVAAKLAGGTRSGIVGAVVGLLAGLLLFPISLISLIILPFVGAIAGELSSGATRKQAVKSGLGTVIGFLVTTAVESALGLALTAYFFVQLLN